MVVHGSGVYQLLMEFVRTDRFIPATSEALELPHPPQHTLHTYSNEKAAWS
ncbi:hypothetical protein EDD90_6308 [Streptomyces sp. Ag109_O5-1]|nr:hypothetical protein EDD90_6308 [Streptomyces sp. Ag109_O5-1]